jgi:hypothetical protein
MLIHDEKFQISLEIPWQFCPPVGSRGFISVKNKIARGFWPVNVFIGGGFLEIYKVILGGSSMEGKLGKYALRIRNDSRSMNGSEMLIIPAKLRPYLKKRRQHLEAARSLFTLN